MIEARIQYDKDDHDVTWFQVGDLDSAGTLMTDFMTNGWYKMEFYTDRKRTHTVLATEDECGPVIVEYHEAYLQITPIDGS